MEDPLRPTHDTRETARRRAESEKQGDHRLGPAESGRVGVLGAGSLLSRRIGRLLFIGEQMAQLSAFQQRVKAALRYSEHFGRVFHNFISITAEAGRTVRRDSRNPVGSTPSISWPHPSE